MRITTLTVASTTLLLTACGQSGDNDCQVGEAFQGCWISERCGQLNDAQGQPMLRWSKTHYRFSMDGALTSTSHDYANANCSGAAIQSRQALGSSDVGSMSYRVQGSEVAHNGLPAWRVDWTFHSKANISLKSSGRVQFAHQRLCFPSWLLLGASRMGFGAGDANDISYTYGRCLLRKP